MKVRHTAALSLGFVLLAGAASAGDAVKGKVIFQRCAICHKTEKNGGNSIGPNLFGIVGRRAGTAPAFAYSPAMKNSGITWTPDKLNAYVEHPAAIVPGTRMGFGGISDAGQRSDLLAYLATLK